MKYHHFQSYRQYADGMPIKINRGTIRKEEGEGYKTARSLLELVRYLYMITG